MSSTKYKGYSYLTHFLKSRGSIMRNNFLKCRTKKKAHNLHIEIICMQCSLLIKQNIFSIGMFRSSIEAQFIVKV